MAARMEATENNRMKRKSREKQQIEISPSDHELGWETILGSADSYHIGSKEALEELAGAFRNILLNLKFAVLVDDPVNSFHLLKEARNKAKELTGKEEGFELHLKF